MELVLKNHNYKYAVEQIMLTLFPGERPIYPQGAPETEPWAAVSLREGGTWVTAVTVLRLGGKRYTGTARFPASAPEGDLDRERLRQRVLKQSFYRAAVGALGKKPIWGSLSGIRPAKLMRNLLDAGLTEREALARFRHTYDVSRERAELCLDAAKAGLAAEAALEKRDVCLYVGIPFCPSRCAYCSFVSQSVERTAGLMAPFTAALDRDMAATAAAVEALGLRVRAVYFGGGTPTALPPPLLEAALRGLRDRFDLSACAEFTVEAGRPDTITEEKLLLLRDCGVSRVSVNPQTMSDRVLAAIGRRHTAEDVRRAMALVRRRGNFSAVNMDLIAGLPADNLESFRNTVERVLDMGPENVTVHTLALKKGSRITLEGTSLPSDGTVAAMVDFAAERLRRAGYRPYYLYRQKFMAGGLENVGWCRPGTENLYNICIMEELRSVLAMGAGASTKLSLGGGGRIERIFAPKYPQEYIGGIEKICADKRRIKEYYHELFTD